MEIPRFPSKQDIQNTARRVAAVVRTVGEVTLAVAVPSAPIAVTHLLNPQTVEAAGPVCDPKRTDYKYTSIVGRVPYYNIGGRSDIFDYGIDVWMEEAVTGGLVKAVDKGTNKVLSEAHYTVTKPTVLNYQAPTGAENIAWSVLQWSGNCDTVLAAVTPSKKTVNVPGKKVVLVASQDEGNKTMELTVPAGGYADIINGRPFKSAEQFLAAYNRNPALVRNLSPKTLEDIRRQVREKLAKPTPAASGNNSGTTPSEGKVEVDGKVEVAGKVEVEGQVTVEGGQTPIRVDITKREDFFWLPATILAGLLGGGALIGLGSRAGRRRKIEKENERTAVARESQARTP